MLNDEIMGYMLSNAYKHQSQKMDTIPGTIKNDVSEKEALQIFNEIIDVMKAHDISYSCACRISIALNEAFLTGAVELYNQDANP